MTNPHNPTPGDPGLPYGAGGNPQPADPTVWQPVPNPQAPPVDPQIPPLQYPSGPQFGAPGPGVPGPTQQFGGPEGTQQFGVPGPFPGEQIPPGQFPPGQFPPEQQGFGQFPPQQFPPGQQGFGQFPSGQFPAGAQGLAGPPASRSHRRRNWLLAGVAVIVVAVVAIVGIVVWTGSGSEKGAGTAEAAALDMLAAATKRDTMGVVALIAPSEAGSLRDVVTSAQKKAEEVGVQKGGGTDGLLEGVTITTENVKTKVDSLRSDLSRITFTDGTLTLRFDPSKANQGLKDLVGADLESGESTIDVRDLRTESDGNREIDPFVVAVEEGGRWYVSPVYTAIEYAMRTQDQGAPDYEAKDIETARYSSPEAAAEGFVEALSDSVSKQSVDPIAAALPAYYGRIVSTYHSVLQDNLDLDGVDRLSFSNAKFSSETKDGVTYVKIDRLDFSARADGDSASGTIEGDCVRIDSESRSYCSKDAATPLADRLASDNGFIATKDSYGWHIDPVQTIIGGALTSVENVTSDQLYRWIGLEADIPEFVTKIKADASFGGQSSVTVTPSERSATDDDYFLSVVDLDVQAGQSVTIEAEDEGSAYVRFRVYDSSGRVESSDGNRSGSTYTPFAFTPTKTETVKIAVYSDERERVTLTRH